MTALPEACADAARWLPEAAALIAEPDADGATGGGRPGSRPPWNAAAADSAMTAGEGLRRLEASLRRAVTGRPGPRRGGSDANTIAALEAIEALGEAIGVEASALAAKIMHQWVRAIQMLPAIDEAERWIRLPRDDGNCVCCPFCGTPNLRAAVRAGLVACLVPGCADSNGGRPVATMQMSVVSGDAILVWGDGLVQFAPLPDEQGITAG